MTYETHELMVARIARELTSAGGHVSVLGSFTPLAYAAYMLAKVTHAPDLLLVGFNAVGIPAVELSFTGAEAAMYRGAPARRPFLELAHSVHTNTRGLMECVSGAQVDASGAVNISAIGPYERPTVRLPGGAGAPEVLQNFRKVVIYSSRHDRRTFVPEVDYVTGRRTPIAAAARAAEGRAGDAPVLVVTPLAVLVKSDDHRPFALESVHPGVTVDEVVQRTGFELDLAGTIIETAAPTEEQIELLRSTIDPFETVRFDFLQGDERIAHLEHVLGQERERAARRIRGISA